MMTTLARWSSTSSSPAPGKAASPPTPGSTKRACTKRWQAARDVEVVGPLLEAVAAGRPSGCHWQRFHRRRADGTLWRHIDKPGPFYVGGVVYFFVWLLLSGSMVIRPSMLSGWLGLGDMVQPRFSLPWCAAFLRTLALAYVLGSLTQIAWYFISDVVRDRRARIAARTSASDARQDEEDATIFVYELTPEVRAKLQEFDSGIDRAGADLGAPASRRAPVQCDTDAPVRWRSEEKFILHVDHA